MKHQYRLMLVLSLLAANVYADDRPPPLPPDEQQLVLPPLPPVEQQLVLPPLQLTAEQQAELAAFRQENPEYQAMLDQIYAAQDEKLRANNAWLSVAQLIESTQTTLAHK